jgi:uncharacterized radical SAM superfamily protein
MTQLSPEAIWRLSEKDLINLLESGTLAAKCREIRFYAPSFTYYKTKHYCSTPNSFPTISITGTSCALKCKHCGGKVLETMQSALTPDELFQLCQKIKLDGAKGCLISGGCLPDGSVPIDGFASVIGRIKHELGLTVFVHTGIVSFETAVLLKDAGVDAALIDVIGSEETVKKVYNLGISVQDYASSLKALQEAGLNFVPHVIVGLNDGRLDGELQALQMISHVEPSAIVIIAFMPIHGTAMVMVQPPKPLDIARVAAVARAMFPGVPLVLGCMRPKGVVRGETDVLALKAGVDAEAFPSEEAIKYAQERGRALFSSFCCAQIFVDAAKKFET